MTTRTDMVCTVCKRHRAQLKARKSKLMPGNAPLFLCSECLEAKREPRWAVIMVARQDGVGAVKDYIRNQRYYGDKILLEEVLP